MRSLSGKKSHTYKLEEALTFTNFFLDTYVSAYYVNLDDLSCQVYKRTDELAEKYPLRTNYFDSIKEYIETDVHPDDRAALLFDIRPERMRELLKKQPEYVHTFRDISGGSEKIYRMQVIRGAEENHAAFGFIDITEEIREQQERLLGAVPLSNDVLTKANIGLWAFEMDEGQPPRMYADTAMLGLLGLDRQIPPEEIYHAWYDHIDEGSYGLVTDAVNKMISGEHAEAQYPWHHPDGRTMIVRCGGVRNPGYTRGIRIEGTHQNVTEVLHFDDEERKALAENNARMLALEDNFESLYDVDLETGRYEMNIKGDTFGDINGRLVNNNEFFEDAAKNIGAVYPDDRDGVLKVLAPAYIRAALAKDSRFDWHYRLLADGSPLWVRMRIVYKDAEKRRVIIGVFNAEEEIAARKRDEDQRNELIAGITAHCNIAYRVNLVSDTFVQLRMDENMIGVGEKFSCFTEAKNFFIEKPLHPGDRDMMRQELDYGVIRKKLAASTSYTVEYRAVVRGATLWHEMSVTRLNGDEVLIGFAEKNPEIIMRRLDEKRNNKYLALFVADLETEMIQPLRTSPLFEIAAVGEAVPYTPALLSYASLYSGEAKDFFTELADPDYIRRELARDDKRTFSYKSAKLGSDKWIEITSYVLCRRPDGTPSMLTFGFSVVDPTATARQELQSRMKEDMQMISGLASEYHALYYINLRERFFKVYSLDRDKFPDVASIVGAGTDPAETFKSFGMSPLVHPDDRHLFAALTPENLREKLAHSKRFSIRFRRNFGGEYLWTVMDVIKYGDIDDAPDVFALGFAERDAEIRGEQALSSCFGVLGEEIPPQQSIEKILSVAGEFYGADRCYIFEFTNNGTEVCNTYEWCATDIEPMISVLQHVPSAEVDGWMEEFRRHGAFCLDSLDGNGAYGSEEGRALLEMQGITSLIAAPMMNGDEIVGFIGVDNPAKAKRDVRVLRNIEIVAYSEILRQKQSQMAAYESAKVFSDTFLDSFVSAYYVNLTDRSQLVFRRDASLTRTYDHAGDYLESVRLYIEECVHPDDRAAVAEAVQPAYIRKRLQDEGNFSVYLRDISGEKIRWYRFDITHGADDNHAGFAFTDVTERLETERSQRKQLEKARTDAEAANIAKTDFLFNMSHDIRTPMNAITGFTNMAIKHIDDRAKVLDSLSKIQQSGSMLLSLINSVLEVSRIESGHAVPSEQPGDIYYSFSNVESTMRELAEAKDINLSFEFADIRDRYVYCDFDRCMRIFVNVISNAVKFTPEGGRVIVRCEQLGKADGGTATYRYTVTDNGIGMSEDFQKHVFEQFTREKTSTVSGVQGTGLGMAVVKSFVDLLGGTVTCQSKQGEGTTFTIDLPFRLQEEENYTDPVTGAVVSSSDPAVHPVRHDFRGKKVLVVEDNALNREITTDILDEEGMITEEAEDGTEAVALLRKKGPAYYDFILMDIQMPVMNGYEAAAAIRAMYPDDRVPIIALSANAFAEDKAASLAAGMDDHVSKPVNTEELLAVLAKLL